MLQKYRLLLRSAACVHTHTQPNALHPLNGEAKRHIFLHFLPPLSRMESGSSARLIHLNFGPGEAFADAVLAVRAQ